LGGEGHWHTGEKWDGKTTDRWLVETWTPIVGSGSEAHYKVTVHRDSWFLTDSWRGTLAYVSKYVAKVDTFTVCEGRSWGYWWRELRLPITLLSEEIPHDTFHAVRRIVRRYIERKTGRRLPSPQRWSGITAYLAEATALKLIEWAWDIGW
jgi:hypothetical protein